MSIKAVIIDLSNTTFNKNGDIQDGIEELISFCRNNNLKVAFITNNPILASKLKNSKLKYDCIANPIVVHAKKPSPRFISYIEQSIGISKDRCIYIGDRDRGDAFCAANAKVLYFCAKWANPNAEYGIPLECPDSAIKYIQTYLLKEELWSWKLENCDKHGNKMRALCLLDFRFDTNVKTACINTFKRENIKDIPFFLNHLITSIYLNELYKEVDYWATYPQHLVGTSINPKMKTYIKIATKEFKKRYLDLFYRYKESRDSGRSRAYKQPVNFENQIGSMYLNSDFRGKIKGKRILVIDDFITKGFSMECARNLLYKAGAIDVICIGFGKYGYGYNLITINNDFDPFRPINTDYIQFEISSLVGEFNINVTQNIEDSYLGNPENYFE